MQGRADNLEPARQQVHDGDAGDLLVVDAAESEANRHRLTQARGVGCVIDGAAVLVHQVAPNLHAVGYRFAWFAWWPQVKARFNDLPECSNPLDLGLRAELERRCLVTKGTALQQLAR